MDSQADQPRSRSAKNPRLDNSGGGNSGGNVSGLIIGSTIERPMSLQTTTFIFEHDYRFTMCAAKGANVWSQDSSFPNHWKMDNVFFEIPVNDMAFWISYIEAQPIKDCAAVKVLNAELVIRNVTHQMYIEQNPANTSKIICPIGGIQPVLQIMHSVEQPNILHRYWDYDAVGGIKNIKKSDNSAGRVQAMCWASETTLSSLPRIVGFNRHNSQIERQEYTTLRINRLSTEFFHGADPYHYSPVFFPHWRRQADINTLHDSDIKPEQTWPIISTYNNRPCYGINQSELPNMSATNLAEDLVTGDWGWRHPVSGSCEESSNYRQPCFLIRVMPYATPTTADTGGSLPNASIICMLQLEVRTTIAVDVDFNYPWNTQESEHHISNRANFYTRRQKGTYSRLEIEPEGGKMEKHPLPIKGMPNIDKIII